MYSGDDNESVIRSVYFLVMERSYNANTTVFFNIYMKLIRWNAKNYLYIFCYIESLFIVKTTPCNRLEKFFNRQCRLWNNQMWITSYILNWSKRVHQLVTTNELYSNWVSHTYYHDEISAKFILLFGKISFNWKKTNKHYFPNKRII